MSDPKSIHELNADLFQPEEVDRYADPKEIRKKAMDYLARREYASGELIAKMERAGYDADLTFVDLDAAWQLERSDVVSSAGYSIYEGWQFRGEIVHAMSRGRFILRDRRLQDEAVGHGRFLKRKL